MFGNYFSSRLAAGGALFYALGISVSPATAQFVMTQYPLSDVYCPGSINAPCQDNGTRKVTVTKPFATSPGANPFQFRTVGQDRIDFAGTMKVGGYPTSVVNFPAEFLFGNPGPVTVSLSTSYLANVDVTGDLNYQTTYANPGFSYEILSKHISAINLDVADGETTDAATGQSYLYSLKSADSSAVMNDAVALSGRYQSDLDGGGAIVFGKLSGTATVVSGTIHTDPQSFGYISPFAVQTQVTAQETTRLDENGLVTPKIAVTDGIDMNGSRVTNLGAGVAATDAVNKGQLDAEAGTRAAADVKLGAAITTEAATRAKADQALATVIDTEAVTRASADTALASSISSEAQSRSTADTALATSLSNETSARMAADAGLTSRLDGLSGRVDQLDSRIDKVDRRAMSGTAVAIAMGGATFLPDTHFNLTANVATYGGSQAGAVQVGALVSRHVAVNAGVASGFGRGARTAGRAGLTLGW